MADLVYHVYWSRSLGSHFVAKASDGALYIVPPVAGGWDQRRPYRGHVAALDLMPPEQARCFVESFGGAFDFCATGDDPWVWVV